MNKYYLNCNITTMLWEGVFAIENKNDMFILRDDEYEPIFDSNSKIIEVRIPESTGAGMYAEAVTHEMAHICFCIINGKPERLLKRNYGMSFSTKNKKSDPTFLAKCFDNELRVAAIQMRIAVMCGYDINDIMYSFELLINNIENLPAFINTIEFESKFDNRNVKICKKYFAEYSSETVMKAWTDAVNFLYQRYAFARHTINDMVG